MENSILTGIERELVLKYLVDGNVPATITPIEKSQPDFDAPKALASKVVSISIDAKDISVLKEGIILLQNAPESLCAIEGKEVKVEFYFNRIGLYFITTMKSVSSGPAIVIPNSIYRIPEIVVEKKYDFSATLYYSITGNDVSFLCVPAEGVEIFTRPVWSSIQLEQQQKAKDYLEQFVKQTKKNGTAGNGLQLINICKYFVEKTESPVEALGGRLKPFDILFLNHERISLGFEKNDAISIKEGDEYALNISFAIKDAPSVLRNVFVTCKIENMYQNEVQNLFAVDCVFTSMKEEDCRFLYEKATSSLFV